MNWEMRAPKKMPPGNHTWNRLSMVVWLFLYIFDTSGLQAASTVPLPNPMKKLESKSVIKSPAKIVIKMPRVCVAKASQTIRLGPNSLYSHPPTMVAIGKPKMAIWLIYPSWVSVKPNCVANSAKIPARIAKANAVVTSAKQLAINNLEALMLDISNTD